MAFDHSRLFRYGSVVRLSSAWLHLGWLHPGWCCLGLLGLGLLACGGAVGGPGGSGGTSLGGEPSSGGAWNGSSGGRVGSGGHRASGGAPGSGGIPYVEPQCPDEPPQAQLECDPLQPDVGCEAGKGCYPYLVYPQGEGCGSPVIGASCEFTSTGEQGEPCGVTNYCAPGFMCVNGAGAGALCAQICPVEGPSGCPRGLICVATDVLGYGVCF